MKIFINYSREDRPDIRNLAEKLRRGIHEPWFDVYIPGGTNWQERISQEIARCDVMLYVLTARSLRSKWCWWELGEAVRQGKPVVPIRWERCRIPEPLSKINYVDFTNQSREDAFIELMGASSSAKPSLRPDEVPQEPPPAQELPPQIDPNRIWTIIVDLLSSRAMQGFAALATILALVVALLALPQIQQRLSPAPTEIPTQSALAPTDTAAPPTIQVVATLTDPAPPTAAAAPSATPTLHPTVTPTSTDTPNVTRTPIARPTLVLYDLEFYFPSRNAEIITPAFCRSGPNYGSSAVASVSAGDSVQVAGHNDAEEWYLIQTTAGDQCWIFETLIRVASPLPSEAELVLTGIEYYFPHKNAEIITSAFCRWGPNYGSAAAASVSAGDLVQVAGNDDTEDWYLIQTTDGDRCWIFEDLIGVASPLPSESALVLTGIEYYFPYKDAEIITPAFCRSGPKYGYSAVASVSPGDSVQIAGNDDAEEWYLIRTAAGDRCWIYRTLIRAKTS